MGEEIIQELSIREIGEKYKISRMMLQRYERIGLIHSTNRDKYGHLYYNKEMINRILFIRFLQDCYFTLPEISKLMHLSIAEIKEALIHQIKELDKQKKVLEKRQETAKKIVNELNETKLNIDEINMEIWITLCMRRKVMKCKQCGTEFTGNYCPECGAKNEELYPQIVPKKLNKRNKRLGVKKPFYKKWWFYVILLLVVSNVMRAITNGNKKTETKDYEEIAWDTVVLRNNLPNPPTKVGTLYINTDEQLWLYLNEVTEDKYYNYLDECINKGFTIDQEKIMDSFNAYNSEGYFLNISYYDNEIRLDLKAPMKLSNISWPISKLGSLLPVPKSLIGKFEYEQEDGFYVYIGETSKEDYDQYVRDCSANGFTVNYYKEEKYYTAENPEGCSLVLEYVGNNIMSISIESPKEKQDANEQLETAEPIVNNESGESVEQVDENGLRPDFKEAMDSYEAFIDKYVEFMKTYDENDASMMMKYLEFVDSYYDMTAKFDAWESEDLNNAELSYYIDVQARTNKKLINISIAE